MFRFPWGDMHSLNLGWFLQKFNELRENWATAEAGIDGALDAEIQRAEDALSDVFDARDAAAASATAAAGSASAAGTSATAAQNSATGAASSATLANQKATAAGLSEAAAAQSATQAGQSATAAAGSATQAGQSATSAGSSATAAAASETAAGNSATAAAGSATAAAASAAAAEAVEESIPEDYSALSNKVSDIENLLSGWKQKNTNMANGSFSIGAPNFNAAKATELEIFAIIPTKSYPNNNFSVDPSGYDENGSTLYQGAGISAGSRLVDFKSEQLILYIVVSLAGNIVHTTAFIQSATDRNHSLTFSMFSAYTANAVSIRAATVYLNNNTPFDEEFPVFYKYKSGNYI